MKNMGLFLTVKPTCKLSENAVSILAIKKSRFVVFLFPIAVFSLVLLVFNAQAQTYGLAEGTFTPTVFHGPSDMSINDINVIVGQIFGGEAWIRAAG